MNMLLFKYEDKPNYYVFDRHEIDFIIQDKNETIIPCNGTDWDIDK